MQELKNWPIIGKMVTNAGTVYIDRSNRKDINIINAAISRVLDADGNVCFFPEARTTLGNGMLPLKAALFQAALDSNAPRAAHRRALLRCRRTHHCRLVCQRQPVPIALAHRFH